MDTAGTSFREIIGKYCVTVVRDPEHTGTLVVYVNPPGERDGYRFALKCKSDMPSHVDIQNAWRGFHDDILEPLLSATHEKLSHFVPNNDKIADFCAWLIEKNKQNPPHPCFESPCGVTAPLTDAPKKQQMPQIPDKHLVTYYNGPPRDSVPTDVLHNTHEYSERVSRDYYMVTYTGASVGRVYINDILDDPIVLLPGQRAYITRTPAAEASIATGIIRYFLDLGTLAIYNAIIHVHFLGADNAD